MNSDKTTHALTLLGSGAVIRKEFSVNPTVVDGGYDHKEIVEIGLAKGPRLCKFEFLELVFDSVEFVGEVCKSLGDCTLSDMRVSRNSKIGYRAKIPLQGIVCSSIGALQKLRNLCLSLICNISVVANKPAVDPGGVDGLDLLKQCFDI